MAFDRPCLPFQQAPEVGESGFQWPLRGTIKQTGNSLARVTLFWARAFPIRELRPNVTP